MHDWRQITESALALCRETGGFIAEQQGRLSAGDVEHKGFNDLVTYVDKTAEKQLVTGLQRILPEAGFITEEKTRPQTGGTYRWIVDPLDGTTNFVHGVPCYCISVALSRDDNVVLGIIYEVNLGEAFYAWLDSPAFLNGKEIRVSPAVTMQHALLATGFPYTNFDRMAPYMEVFDYCMRHTQGLRRMGSAAVDLAYVAAGRFEGFFEYGLNAWDVAAGAFIVERAGGRVSDFSGGRDFIFGREIVAMNAGLYDPFMKVVGEKFG